MPRHSNKGRTKLQHRMSFKKMCNLVGIDPIKRVKLMKLIQENLLKGNGVDNTK